MENNFVGYDENTGKVSGIVIGTDEAGRGPLAGPVCASSVILPSDFPFDIIADSKALSEKKRLLAEPVIKEKAIAWAIAWATPEEIDTLNILNASLLAMKRSFIKVQKILETKNIKAHILLVDGNRKPPIDFPIQTIVKGDSKVHEIMAASILAKNARDRFMEKAALKWPQYGFERHKGYPCPSHKAVLREIGPCPIHRLTFKY
ncbi:MAG: ribonuclease HII [Sphaerochaetaceae bacterium]|nr:ribonuclease HII [Sphaerochaetaceae bacterium]